MRAFVSFILVLIAAAFLLPLYSVLLQVASGHGSQSFFEEKRFYDISDMQNSMGQTAAMSLQNAKVAQNNLKGALMALGVAPESLAGLDSLQLERKYVYMGLVQDASRLRAQYPQYDLVFWCGFLQDGQRQPLLESMQSEQRALKCSGCMELENPLCENAFLVQQSENGLKIAPADPNGFVAVLGGTGASGFGVSVFDRAANQSSVQFMGRIMGAHT